MNRYIFYFAVFLISIVHLEAQTEEPPVDSIFQSVVLVRNEGFYSENKSQPWMRKNLYTGFGSGLVLPNQLILTNAHVVLDAKRILVRTPQSKKEFIATVKFIGYDCDLALLEVKDPSFSETTNTLSFADGLPNLGTDVLMLGYPNGNENLSVEKGSILRLEKNRYSYSGLDFRNVLKVSANIQPGNSGGPAIQDGKVVGLVFQISKVEKGIAYLIPNDIIQHFLKDIADGNYDGFPNLGFTFQSGSPRSLKQAMKLPLTETGVFVNRIYPMSTFSEKLKEKDFVTSIDGFVVSNDGEMVIGTKKEFITDYIENKQLGEDIELSYFRAGNRNSFTVKLQKTYSLELYRESSDDFLLQAGFVFQPISRSFFANEESDLDSSLRYHYSYFIQDLLYKYTARDIVLSFIFNDPETSKYKKYRYKVVETINGIIPKNMDDFKKIWSTEKRGMIVLKFRGMDLPIVLRQESTAQINQRVKKRYGANYADL